MAVHKITLVAAETKSYFSSTRMVLEEGVFLQGMFRHNRSHHMAVSVFDSKEGLEAWSREGHAWDAGRRGVFSAQASVISLHQIGAAPTVIQVAVGDILETNIGNFKIEDSVWGHDPQLVLA